MASASRKLPISASRVRTRSSAVPVRPMETPGGRPASVSGAMMSFSSTSIARSSGIDSGGVMASRMARCRSMCWICVGPLTASMRVPEPSVTRSPSGVLIGIDDSSWLKRNVLSSPLRTRSISRPATR